jgi:MFS family permease
VSKTHLLSLSDRRGRLTLVATVLGSGIAFLDGTVVNVALPTIGRELDSGITGLQWVVSAYALTLASLILLGGSLGDRYGRRRIYEFGIAGFAVCSFLCAISPTIEVLVAARALQGIAAALLTPGSLAILQATFRPEDRMRAIGAWSGMVGIATAAGPILGGWLVGWTWRAIFWLNIPLAVVVVLSPATPTPPTTSTPRAWSWPRSAWPVRRTPSPPGAATAPARQQWSRPSSGSPPSSRSS